MIGFLLTTIVPALLPTLADGARGLFARLTGGAGAQPQNVEEAIQLMQAKTEHLRALADMDRIGENVSGWVQNVRALMRPVIALMVIPTWAVAIFGLAEVPPEVHDLAQAVTFYLFGERTRHHLRNRQ